MQRIAIALLTFLILGCSGENELTRESAHQLISTSYANAEKVTVKIPYGRYSTRGKGSFRGPHRDYVDALNSSGLGSATFQIQEVIIGSIYSVNVKLTESGKQYLVSVNEKGWNGWPEASVVFFDQEFGEITGIAYLNEARTKAKVEYTEIIRPTPFAAVYKKFKPKSTEVVPESPRVSSATFQLYDDGWRIAL